VTSCAKDEYSEQCAKSIAYSRYRKIYFRNVCGISNFKIDFLTTNEGKNGAKVAPGNIGVIVLPANSSLRSYVNLTQSTNMLLQREVLFVWSSVNGRVSLATVPNFTRLYVGVLLAP
jgi:hypothetical protein